MIDHNEPGTWRKGLVADGPEVREYDGQGLRRLIAMARDPEQARRIVSALQAVESVPQRFALRADVVKWLDTLYLTLIDPRESGVPVPPWRQK